MENDPSNDPSNDSSNNITTDNIYENQEYVPTPSLTSSTPEQSPQQQE